MIHTLKRKRSFEPFEPQKRQRPNEKVQPKKRMDLPFSFGYELEMFHAGIARITPEHGWQLAPMQTILSNPYVRANRDRNFTGDFSRAFREDLRGDSVTIFDAAWKSMPAKMQRVMHALPPINVLEVNTTPSFLPRDAAKEGKTEAFVYAFDQKIRNAVAESDHARVSFEGLIRDYNEAHGEIPTHAGEGAKNLYLIAGQATKRALNTSRDATYYPQLNFSVTWESFGKSESGAVLENFMRAFSLPPRRKRTVGAEDILPHSRENAERALAGLRDAKGLHTHKLQKLQGFFSSVALMAHTAASKDISHGGTPKNKYHFMPKNKPSDLLANTLSKRDKQLLAQTSVAQRAAIVAALARGLRGVDESQATMFEANQESVSVERFIRSALGWDEPGLADKLFGREGVRFLDTQPEAELGYTLRKEPLHRPVFESRNLVDLRKLGSVFELTRAAKEQLPFYNQTSKSRK